VDTHTGQARGRCTPQVVLIALAVLAALAVSAGCAAPDSGGGGAAQSLLVLNAGDATVSEVPADSGRTVGPTVAVPAGAVRLVPGPAGGAVALATTGPAAGALTLIVRSSRDPDRRLGVRPLALGAGAVASHIAGDGRVAAALVRDRAPAPDAAGGSPCGVALIDTGRGTAGPAHPVCQPGEEALSLALGAGPTGSPLAFVGLWSGPAPGGAGASRGVSGGRIVAVEAATGRVLRTAALREVAAELLALPARPGVAPRLLCVCGPPAADRIGRDGLLEAVTDWRVLQLDPETLTPEAVSALPARPHALAAAPEGGAVYALSGGLDVGSRASVVHLDADGGARTLAVLAGRAAGLAVGAEHVYVPQLDGRAVWVIDRRRGTPSRPIPAGRRPVALALAP
jgi:hypothetical protein